MIQGKVLVTGATGDTGRATVDELLARGHQVRALAHGQDERSKKLQERGVEVVYGDLLDFGQVRAALNGVQRAYFVYPIRPGILQATAYFAQAAKEAGVDGIVNMSQKSAREDAKSHAATDHWLSERIFDWSGVTVAHIRPTYFAEWLLYLAPMIKAGLLHVPFGTGKHAPIAAEDQGRVIAGILEDPAPHRGQDISALRPGRIHVRGDRAGPEPGAGEDVEYKQVDFEEFSRALQASGKNAGRENSFLFQHLREVAIDHQNGIFAGTNDLVEKLGGRPPMTLEAFIKKHRGSFRLMALFCIPARQSSSAAATAESNEVRERLRRRMKIASQCWIMLLDPSVNCAAARGVGPWREGFGLPKISFAAQCRRNRILNGYSHRCAGNRQSRVIGGQSDHTALPGAFEEHRVIEINPVEVPERQSRRSDDRGQVFHDERLVKISELRICVTFRDSVNRNEYPLQLDQVDDTGEPDRVARDVHLTGRHGRMVGE